MAAPNPDLLVTVFEEMGHTIRYQIEDDKLWVCAKDLAKPLFKTEDAIRVQIKSIPDDQKGVRVIYTLGGNQNMTFVTKAATLWMINRSNAKPGSLVYKFQWWCANRLDELLTKGKVSLFERRLNIAENWTKALLPTMTAPNTTNETKQFANAMVANTSNRLENYDESNVNNDIPMGIENRLILKFNLKDPTEIRSLSIKIGKLACKKYKEIYKLPPNTGNELVWGQMQVSVKIYEPEDYEDWLDELIQKTIVDLYKAQNIATLKKQSNT